MGSNEKSTADLDVLTTQLQLLLENPDAASKDDAQGLKLKHLLRAASVALEHPFETLQRVAYSPMPLVTARISQDHKIFATLTAAKEPVSLKALQDASNLELGVLESIMDYICSQQMALEVESGKYVATKLSHLLMEPLFQDTFIHFHDNCLPGFAALNTVLSRPDEKLSAFKVGQRSEHDFYGWMQTHPVQQAAFHGFMRAQYTGLPTWLDVVDFEAEMGKGLTDADVAFVDVGGSNGQQCAALKKKLPHLKGRVVLQDRPEVLEKALAVDDMEKMTYDYLTEQPVKDARVYYFRQVLHNNNDEGCLRILKSQVAAMGAHSVVVIDEKTLPDDKPPQGTPGMEYTGALGLAMKVMFDAQERREAHWRELLDKAGLVVKDIRKFTKFDDSVIIAAKK